MTKQTREESLRIAKDYDPEARLTPPGSDIPAQALMATLEREAALEAEVGRLRCPDTLTAGALANMIEDRRIASPWRDAGIRLTAFGKWLSALAKEQSE